MKKVFKNALLAVGFSAVLAATPLALAADHGDEHGGGGHGASEPATIEISASQAMREIIEGNDRFKETHDSKYFEPYQNSQAPVLTVVTCSDSRVHTNLFGFVPDNNIFVIRNIGNQMVNSEGSVDYGVRHLPTKILMILGHSSCGAVKAAMGDYSGETAGIKKELDPLKPVTADDDHNGEFKVRWAKNIEQNVDYQVNYALKLYADKVAHGDLVIVGAVYDFNDIYAKGRGSLIITNIDGKKSPSEIMQHSVFKDVNPGQVVTHVSSRAQ